MGFLDNLARADANIRTQLGETLVVYTATGGDPVTVSAIFDTPFLEEDGSKATTSTSGPVVWFLLSDLPDTAPSDRTATITCRGISYRPWELQPDGQGTLRILLHEVD